MLTHLADVLNACMQELNLVVAQTSDVRNHARANELLSNSSLKLEPDHMAMIRPWPRFMTLTGCQSSMWDQGAKIDAESFHEVIAFARNHHAPRSPLTHTSAAFNVAGLSSHDRAAGISRPVPTRSRASGRPAPVSLNVCP